MNFTKLDDKDLIDSFKEGLDGAFEALFQRHSGWMIGVAYTYCLNRHDAEDIVQEVFIALLTNKDIYRYNKNIKSWLYTITKNKSFNLRKKKKPLPSPKLLENRKGSDFSKEETRLMVNDALDKISKDAGEVLILRHLQGLSYDEIAEILDIPLGTVKSRISRAREEFYILFRGDGL